MHNEELNSVNSKLATNVRCAICNKIISKSDLIHVSPDETNEFIAHFNCYIELQDKICSECGLPFFNKEEILFCEDHKEYFHENNACIKNHLNKHTRFRKAIYNASNNRIILQETIESLSNL